jgi:hypothetical protein
MSRRVIPAREASRIGFWNHLRASCIGDFGGRKSEVTRRADMSRRVIPAREALRVGVWNYLWASHIGNFGGRKHEVPDLEPIELAHTQQLPS